VGGFELAVLTRPSHRLWRTASAVAACSAAWAVVAWSLLNPKNAGMHWRRGYGSVHWQRKASRRTASLRAVTPRDAAHRLVPPHYARPRATAQRNEWARLGE